jgi:hypothetical protein
MPDMAQPGTGAATHGGGTVITVVGRAIPKQAEMRRPRL